MMKGFIKIFAGTLLVLALNNAYLSAYIRSTTSGGTPLRRTDANSIQFHLNDQTAPGLPNITSDSDPRGAIESAMRSWARVPTSAINFAPLQSTSVATSQFDRLNIISFVDTPENRTIAGGGTLAVTIIRFNSVTGDLVDTDIIFSPTKVFSTTLQPNTFDLESIAVHEIGHALGAAHSGVLNATMFYAAGPKAFGPRTLSSDDTALATEMYPNPLGPEVSGTLSGSVTSNGQPVFAALVVAVDTTRHVTLGGVTATDGRFTIKGVPKGDYLVYAEPMNGLVEPRSSFPGGQFSGATIFPTTFWGGNQTPSLISVEGGATVSVDITVPSRAPTLNIVLAGRTASATDRTLTVRGLPFSAAPGESFLIGLAGDGLDRITGINQIRILGPGIQIDQFRSVPFGRPGGSTIPGVVFLANVAPDAEPGPRTMLVDDGNTLSAFTAGLQIIGSAPLTERLIFPFHVSSNDSYTGFALFNPGDTSAVVSVSAYNDQGKLITGNGVRNSRGLSLPTNSQLARFGSELFTLPSDGQPRQGWVEVAYAPGSQLRGFFVFGDTAGNTLNGAEASNQLLSNDLIFLNTPQGARASTTIIAVNPSDNEVAHATFNLIRGDGANIGTANRTIPAKGRVTETIQQLFGIDSVVDDVYVRATSDVRLAGLELMRANSSNVTFSVNGQPASSATTSLFSPQLASGRFGNISLSTQLCLVNPNASAVMADIGAVGDNGSLLAAPASIMIPAQGIVCRTADSLFNLGSAGVTGSMKITSSGGPIHGSVAFIVGDPNQPTAGSVLPLTTQLAGNLIYSHVAQGLGYFTGLAFFNPSDSQTASIRIDVFDSDGRLTGSATSGSPAFPSLRPGQRLSRNLNELVPSVTTQLGGFIKITSPTGLASYELFGSLNESGFRFLAPVPPQ